MTGAMPGSRPMHIRLVRASYTGNYIGDEGLDGLCRGLRENNRLTELHLERAHHRTAAAGLMLLEAVWAPPRQRSYAQHYVLQITGSHPSLATRWARCSR